MQCCRSAKLFHACDSVISGSVSVQEGFAVLKALDSTVTITDASQTFKQVVGAGDPMNEINEEQFSAWCDDLFAEYTDEQFEQKIEELIISANMCNLVHRQSAPVHARWV